MCARPEWSGCGSWRTPPQQTPPPRPQTQTKTTPEKPTTAATVTGCLERQSEATGAAGAATAGAQGKSKATYRLTRIDPDSLKNMAKMTGAAAEATPMTEVKVKASGKVDLAAHVDHKVELTGKLASAKPSTKAGEHMATFEASSLKMVASSCQ